MSPPAAAQARDVLRYNYKSISQSGVNFIDSLVRQDHKERMSMADLNSHPYFDEDLAAAPKLDAIYSEDSKQSVSMSTVGSNSGLKKEEEEKKE